MLLLVITTRKHSRTTDCYFHSVPFRYRLLVRDKSKRMFIHTKYTHTTIHSINNDAPFIFIIEQYEIIAQSTKFNTKMYKNTVFLIYKFTVLTRIRIITFDCRQFFKLTFDMHDYIMAVVLFTSQIVFSRSVIFFRNTIESSTEI